MERVLTADSLRGVEGGGDLRIHGYRQVLVLDDLSMTLVNSSLNPLDER